jgi:hypothetical protein
LPTSGGGLFEAQPTPEKIVRCGIAYAHPNKSKSAHERMSHSEI